MNMKQIFRTLTWVIFLDVVLLGATKNTVANIPRNHHSNQNDNLSGQRSDDWPTKVHHNSKISMATTNGVDMGGNHGDDLSDEELGILLPLLIKNVHLQTMSRKSSKGSKKKAGLRGHWKKLAKTHPEISQIFGDKNPLVDGHHSGNEVRLVAEKHFELVKHVEEKKSSSTKDTQTKAVTTISDDKERNNQDFMPNTGQKETLSAEHSGLLLHHATLHQNPMTASKIHLNLPKEPTTVRSHHRTRHHGNHKAPPTDSPTSKDDNSLDNKDVDVGTTDVTPYAISESKTVINHIETAAKDKKYKKTLEDWRRKNTDDMMNQPEGRCDCENGGSCILRVVCVCPQEYYGTRCQHKLHHHSCGDVRHGTWIRHGCTLCRCQDGNMLCMTKDIGNCDEVIDQKEVILEPETNENDRIDTYILPHTTPSLDDIEIDAIDSDMLVFEFDQLPLPSKSNNVFPTVFSSLLVFNVITFVL